MAFSISYIFQAIDKFSGVGRKMQDTMDKLKQSIDRTSVSTDKFSEKLKRLGNSTYRFGRVGLLRLTLPMVTFGSLAVKQAANIETATLSLESFTGSADKAKKMVSSLQALSQKSMVSFDDLFSTSKGLMALGQSEEQAIKTLHILRDVSAGSRMEFKELGAIINKVVSSNGASLQEIQALGANGIPFMQTLQGMLKVKLSARKLEEAISKGALKGDIFIKVLEKLTQQGGIFHKAAEKHDKSINGSLLRIKNNSMVALSALGAEIAKSFNLNKNFERFANLLERVPATIAKFAKENPNLFKFLVILGGILAIVPPLALALGLLIKSFAIIGALLGFMFLNPIGLAILAIAGLVYGITKAYNKFEAFRNIVKSTGAAIKSFVDFISEKLSKLDFGLLKTEIVNGQSVVKAGRLFEPGAIANGVANNGANFGNAFSNRFGFAPSPFANKNNSTAKIEININDKNNNIKSVEAKKSAGIELDVGKNMPYVR